MEHAIGIIASRVRNGFSRRMHLLLAALGVSICLHAGATPKFQLYAGGGTTIRDGQTTFAYTNLTNFGAVPFTGSVSVTHYFVIKNIGNTSLILTGPGAVLSQSGSDFSLTQVDKLTLTPNDFTSFAIIYDPTSAGPHTASISIDNNDATIGTFNFDVAGTGDDAASLLAPDLSNFNFTCLKLKNTEKNGKVKYKFTATMSVLNQGPVPSLPGTRFVAYADDNGFLDTDDAPSLKAVKLKKPLAPGETRTVKLKFTLPRVPTARVIMQVQTPEPEGDRNYANNLFFQFVPLQPIL